MRADSSASAPQPQSSPNVIVPSATSETRSPLRPKVVYPSGGVIRKSSNDYYQIRMAARKPIIVDTASPRAGFKLEVVSGTRFELLIAMYAAAGARGELWLHLLGLALDSRAPDAGSFIEEVAGVPALELRRHVLGLYVPSWRHVAGAGTIEQAARGDADACERLLGNRRYYAGAARPALAAILPLGARQTKSRLIAALRTFHDSGFAAREE